MLAAMSSRLFAEWAAYAELEPFGESLQDWRAGMIAATVANVNIDPKRKAFQPQDFMPVREHSRPQAPQVEWRTVLANVELWNTALGGRDMRQ